MAERIADLTPGFGVKMPLKFGGRVLTIAAILLLVAGVALAWLAITKTTGRDALVATAGLRAQQTSELTASLTRTAQLGDGDAQVILTPQTFFQLTNRAADGTGFGADRSVVFVVNENVHYTDLPHHFGAILRVDDARTAVPTETRVLTDAVHHRTSVLIFGDVPASVLHGDHTLELQVPLNTTDGRAALTWRTPIAYPDDLTSPAGLSLGLLLSLAAGLLAAISPCLLQLTAFYLPTLAGVSADAAASRGARRRMLPSAGLFVLGFTVPYTAGGVLMGGVGSALAATGMLTPTGPIAVGAGLVMIAMAFLVAFRARAPLVCRLPMPAVLARPNRLPFAEAFVSGFAIATGCLACFGGAILGVLLVYTGLLGSPLLGGLAMFLFSVGLAVPFLLAAFGLSHFAPATALLERATPAVGAVTAALMLFFGLTMATGNYHVVSGWLYQHLPIG
jgi:cytochrome c-type biogenesis protein